jgi:hypothetical protein
MTKPRSKAALVRREQKKVDVKTARAWFQQMIEEMRREGVHYADTALLRLEIRVREWRP